LRHERQPWRGELSLLGHGRNVPVSVRAEVVAARDGSVFGFFLIFVDLTESRKVAEARRHLEESLSRAGENSADTQEFRAVGTGEDGDLMEAILSNASLAAMDIADGGTALAIAPLLEELEVSTRRATELYDRIKLFDR